jgi:hypothetical protein
LSADRPDVALALAEILASLDRLHAKVDALQRNRQGLHEGRRKAILQARAHGGYSRALVSDLLGADLQAGHGDRGRGKRIYLLAAGKLSYSTVTRILRALSSVSARAEQD